MLDDSTQSRWFSAAVVPSHVPPPTSHAQALTPDYAQQGEGRKQERVCVRERERTVGVRSGKLVTRQRWRRRGLVGIWRPLLVGGTPEAEAEGSTTLHHRQGAHFSAAWHRLHITHTHNSKRERRQIFNLHPRLVHTCLCTAAAYSSSRVSAYCCESSPLQLLYLGRRHTSCEPYILWVIDTRSLPSTYILWVIEYFAITSNSMKIKISRPVDHFSKLDFSPTQRMAVPKMTAHTGTLSLRFFR